MNSRFVLFGIVFSLSTVCCYAQWTATENDALATTNSEPQSIYIIKKGDTLWDLAFQFLGDPFRWPELWHANEYIKNPNLIYPGDKLAISVSGKKGKGGGGGTGNADETESMTSLTSPASDAVQEENASFGSELSQQENAEKNQANDAESFIPLKLLHNDFFTSERLERTGFLWFNKDARGLIYPGNAVIKKTEKSDRLKKDSKNIYQQFDEIEISAIGKMTYAVGDTVDVFHSDRFVKFKGKTANIVRRIARARVTKVSADDANAILFKVWDIVTGGDRIDTIAHFPTWEIDTLVDRDVVIKGTIFERIEATESPYLFQTVLCDRGTQDGVRFGDCFFLYQKGTSSATGSPNALGCAIHVGNQSSTLVIEKLFDITVVPGDTVELIKRIRFK